MFKKCDCERWFKNDCYIYFQTIRLLILDFYAQTNTSLIAQSSERVRLSERVNVRRQISEHIFALNGIGLLFV